MVIRCSSVSTLTRIDWLAILSASWTSATASVAAAFLGLGFLLDSGLRRGRGFLGCRGGCGRRFDFDLGLTERAFEIVERDFAGTQGTFQHLIHPCALRHSLRQLSLLGSCGLNRG